MCYYAVPGDSFGVKGLKRDCLSVKLLQKKDVFILNKNNKTGSHKCFCSFQTSENHWEFYYPHMEKTDEKLTKMSPGALEELIREFFK